MDEEYLVEAMSKMMMEFSRKGKRRDAAQQAVESVVKQVGYFNGVEVQKFLKAYNAEMGSRGVNEALRLEYFCRVVAEPIYEEMKEHQEAHDSWVSFEEALREAYGYKEQKGRGLYEFDQWISSKKTHQTAMDAFVEFESRFAQLTERDQRLVGVDKALLFIKSIDRRERNSIGIQLEDDDGANGLTENWAEVERVCRRHDKRKMGLLSTTSRPMRNDQRGRTCGNTPPLKEESSKWGDTSVLDIEAFIKEAYESLKVQVEAKEKLIMKLKPRQMVIKEEETSRQMQTNDAANTKAQIRYDGTIGEGVEQATFSTFEETKVKGKGEDSRAGNTALRVDEHFGTHVVSEISSDEGASMNKACVIEECKKCEADVIEVIATKKDIESEMAMDESMVDGCFETFSTLVPETWAVASECQRETQATEGGGEKAKVDADTCDKEGSIIEACSIKKVNGCEVNEIQEVATKNDNKEVAMDDTVKVVEQRHMESSTPILKNSAIVPMSQCETGETKGSTEDAKDKAMAKDGVKEGKVGSRSGQKMIWPEFQPERKSNQAETDSVESRSVEADPDRSQSSRKPVGRDQSGQKLRRPSRRSKWSSLRHLISKQSRHVNTRKSPSKPTTMDAKGKANLKGVTQDAISTKKMRLRRVVSVGIQMRSYKDKRKTRKNEGSKFLDQGDGRDEGGTCAVREGTYSREVIEPMISGPGERYERRIWWIGWRRRFG